MTDTHARYADWDAAYVLGALSPVQRREFETHIESCDRCRTAVAELSGLPGLLGRLDSARAFELLDDDTISDATTTAIPPPPAELVARIERREAVRRSRRIRVFAGLVAAAVVAGAIAVPVAIASAPHPDVSTALSQVTASPLTAEVKLTKVGWGTKLEMSCHYRASSADGPSADRWNYALWVVQKNGAASEVSSWSATSGSTVDLAAGTAVPVDEIAQVQVRSVDDGSVLLSSTLK